MCLRYRPACRWSCGRRSRQCVSRSSSLWTAVSRLCHICPELETPQSAHGSHSTSGQDSRLNICPQLEAPHQRSKRQRENENADNRNATKSRWTKCGLTIHNINANLPSNPQSTKIGFRMQRECHICTGLVHRATTAWLPHLPARLGALCEPNSDVALQRMAIGAIAIELKCNVNAMLIQC